MAVEMSDFDVDVNHKSGCSYDFWEFEVTKPFFFFFFFGGVDGGFYLFTMC